MNTKFFPVIVASLAWFTLPAALIRGTQERSPTALARLENKTGWIPLGIVTPDLKEWAAGFSDPNAVGPRANSATFEIVGRQVDEHSPHLPAVGDNIRILVPLKIIVVDYATEGERHRLTPPMISRGLQIEDETGLWLEPGTEVAVREVTLAPNKGPVRWAWARVSPID